VYSIDQVKRATNPPLKFDNKSRKCCPSVNIEPSQYGVSIRGLTFLALLGKAKAESSDTGQDRHIQYFEMIIGGL